MPHAKSAPDHSPTENVSVEQLLVLAREYDHSAKFLLEHYRRDTPQSLAPFCFAALQAIELYLNALLLHAGWKRPDIGKLRHSYSDRIDAATALGLTLRQRTVEHLKGLTKDCEFLVWRYHPELMPKSMQTNRLTATLDEVAKKVTKLTIGKSA